MNSLPNGACNSNATKDTKPSKVTGLSSTLLFCSFIVNEAAIRGLQNIERDFMSLREKLKGSGAQVVLSILPFGDGDPGGRRCKVKMNY